MSALFVPDPAVVALLAPPGGPRASIDLGNPVLAARGPLAGLAAVARAIVAPPDA